MSLDESAEGEQHEPHRGPDEAALEEHRQAQQVKPAEPVLDPEQAEAEVVDAIVAAQFSGPVPPPEILRAYDDVVDNGAERIISQWEGETRHRQTLESQRLDAFISSTMRAQWMAFGVILIVGAGGLVLVALGHSLAGFAGFFLALASVVASLFPGSRNRNPES
ncbi:MAG TPA: DUF2335 domain-containing protein [Solirubrobacterales bacterium]